MTVAPPMSSSGRGLELVGRRVLIAGAGGIGAACAAGFAAEGAMVLLADRDVARLDVLRNEPQLTGVSFVAADLSTPGAGDELVATALDELGGLDVALHCIGINDRRPILEFTDDEWTRILDVNLSTAFRFAQAAGRHMVARGSGRIVLLSSVAGLLAHRNHAPYAASKGGINQMMRVMAHEWAVSGVGVNAIAPGYIETGLTAAHLARAGVRDGLTALVPAGRLGVVDDVVGPALFLASDRSAFITGQVLYVDGGRTLV